MFLAVMNAPQRAHQFRQRNRDFNQCAGLKLLDNHPAREATDPQTVAYRVLDGFGVPQFHPKLELRQVRQQQVIDNFTRTGALLTQNPLRLCQALQRDFAL